MNRKSVSAWTSALTGGPSGAAFTLVEMLIVVMIVGVTAVLAVPLFRETDATRLAEAARLLVADVQFAQMESINHASAPRGLKFDTAAESYSVVRFEGPPPHDCDSAITETDVLSNGPYVTTYGAGRAALLADVEIVTLSLDGDDCLLFGSLGEADQDTAGTITLRSGTQSMTLSVDPISGDVTAGS
jgi:prepilin-type N-terminal cleavage/methylation domain-containing protein